MNCMLPESLISSTLKQESSNLFFEALSFNSGCSVEEAYHQVAEVRSTCSSGCYGSVLHAYGLSTAVDAIINLVYPMFNERIGIQPFLNDAIVPIHRSRGEEIESLLA